MSRKIPLAEGETSRTACVRVVLRAGVEERTGELLPAAVLAERACWAAALVSGMVAGLLAEHWNSTDVDMLASGADAGSRRLPSNAWMALRRLAISGLGHAVVAWALIWLFYGFRFSPFAPALADGANYNHGWGWMMVGLEGVERRVIVTLKDWRLLPDAFLYGFTFVLQFAKQRGAFLDGDYSIHGWVRFFPLTFLWKTTLPLLLVFIGGLMSFELVRGMWGYHQPGKPSSMILRGMADTFGMKVND